MKKIKRDKYLNKVIRLKDTPDIKIITGVRRSGKSELLLDYIDYIKENDNNCNIIFIDLNNLKYEELKNYKKLNKYVLSKYIKDKKNYLLIDEIQMCKKFELVINSLHNEKIFDIYLTGSNAFLLSSDLATLFTGRTMIIEMLPFSFFEYCEYYSDDKNINTLFDEYIKDGGLSGSYLYKSIDEKKEYIKSVYSTIVNRDLIEKYKINDVQLLNNISNYLMDNISNLSSSNNITNTINNSTKSTTHNTVGNYINYLCNSFLFYKVKRYDLKGKKYLATSEKYYLVDPSFRNINLGTTSVDYGRVYENIVYLELKRRGYEIYIGKLYNSEIDFVVKKGDEEKYIQVSASIDNKDTLERELKSLLSIKSNFEKILIARTYQPTYTIDGVKVIDLVKWLLNEK